MCFSTNTECVIVSILQNDDYVPGDGLETSSDDEDYGEVDPKALQLSEEERIERELDDKNMKVETKAKGDGENIPVGFRIASKYICFVYIYT